VVETGGVVVVVLLFVYIDVFAAFVISRSNLIAFYRLHLTSSSVHYFNEIVEHMYIPC